MDPAAIAGNQLGAGLTPARKEQSIDGWRNDLECTMSGL